MDPEMVDLLNDLSAYLSQRADVNADGDGPNTAMRLQQRVDAALAALPAETTTPIHTHQCQCSCPDGDCMQSVECPDSIIPPGRFWHVCPVFAREPHVCGACSIGVHATAKNIAAPSLGIR
jgi:hypothetical protein